MSSPRPRDETGFLWREEGSQKHTLIADVAPILQANRVFSYAVSDELMSSITVGRRVMIPLGAKGRLVQGFVLEITRRPWNTTLRSIERIVDDESYLSPELLQLGRTIAGYYHCPLGRTLKAITPEAVRIGRGLKIVRYARWIHDRPVNGEVGSRKQSAKRIALLDALKESTEPVRVDQLLNRSGASPAVLRSAARDGWIEIFTRKEVLPSNEHGGDVSALHEPTFRLNDEQHSAIGKIIESIDEGRFSVTLLFGVSGSGKTEVYIRAIQHVLAMGKQAILLVPEIMLTTQLVTRLSERFAHVAVVHSGLSESQRSLVWRAIQSGTRDVVIGTRSAVFAPCPRLGLICVDEEQESSYKNLQAPRFHVRDVAILRAKQSGFPVVLGSATPSLEAWYNSQNRPDYRCIRLRNRVRDLPLPPVLAVDMRREITQGGNSSAISQLLEKCLSETLQRGEQAVILINRRGFATRVFCPACKTQLTCPHCNVGLVVHATTGDSICHYCRTRTPTPTICPDVTCRHPLVRVGHATQSVEGMLQARFPNARIRRVDSDAMRHRSRYQEVVDEFSARRIDVIVGTQMIAKGLDFPGVSLVGVVHADAVGVAADFRNQERLFQLLTQVAGRAGRADARGAVVVQTMNPDLPAVSCALRHDFEAFARGELAIRQNTGFPPFGRLTRFVLAHPREEQVRKDSEALADRIRNACSSTGLSAVKVFGPNPCALTRLRKQYRYDVLVRTSDRAARQRLLAFLDSSGIIRIGSSKLIVDIDPLHLA